ncbi:T9SS type A sorting domain-containing protein [Flavobacterium rhizosphaerae]|uniref:T9SS type A sorting domain-containing protein n=1 Tax=Flavobacterium rhizosphaerae TaxID=3163298 RepID=A0ABW8Z2Q7_9FLAO
MPEIAGTGDGSSWENAANDLQLMINTAVAGDNIYVAAGTYLPNRKANDLATVVENDKDNAFVLKEGVMLYGSFTGVETSPSERDMDNPANITILSGDFNNDDVVTGTGASLVFENNTENAYHVIIGLGTEEAPITNATIIDGFYITGGNASDPNAGSITINEINVGRYVGGGIVLYNYASPIITNVSIYSNTAIYGGGMYCRNFSAPIIDLILISGNHAESGGGICSWTDGLPSFQYSTISGNSAIAGGGVYNYQATPIFTDCTLIQNATTTGAGGGMYNYYASPVINNVLVTQNIAVTFGGGICNWSHSESIINASQITLNNADTGGGIYNDDLSAPIVDNTTISSNTATNNGGGIYSKNATGTYTNFSITDNMASVGGGLLCFNASPFFANGTISGNTASAKGGGLGNYQESAPAYTNCLITQNTAPYGGGMYNAESAPVFTNLTLSGNIAFENAGGIANYDAFPIFRNSIIYGNLSLVAPNVYNYNTSESYFYYCLVQGSSLGWIGYGIDGGNNMDADPLFTDASNDDYTLQPQSPAFNTGNNAYFGEGQEPDLTAVTLDLAGNERIYNNTNIDLGAYETQATSGLANFNSITVQCYPNPVTNALTIKSADIIENAIVYNAIGQEVIHKKVNNSTTILDFSELKSGIYFVHITTLTKQQTVKVIKE